MFVALWEFEVKPGSEERFEKAYGPEGTWGKLFRHSPAYKGTRLLRDVERPRTYLTMDCWEKREKYEEFLKTHRKEYEALDRECESMTTLESMVGEFVKPTAR